MFQFTLDRLSTSGFSKELTVSRRHLREKSAPQERVPHSAFHIALPVAHSSTISLSLVATLESGRGQKVWMTRHDGRCTLTEMAAPDGAVTSPF